MVRFLAAPCSLVYKSRGLASFAATVSLSLLLLLSDDNEDDDDNDDVRNHRQLTCYNNLTLVDDDVYRKMKGSRTRPQYGNIQRNMPRGHNRFRFIQLRYLIRHSSVN